jgi:hypothetical protein
LRHSATIDRRRRLVPLLPFFVIWGIQWVLDALLDYKGPWDPNGLVHAAFAGVAVILSVYVAIRQSRQHKSHSLWEGSILTYLPLAIWIASIWLLVYVQAIDVNYLHLFLVVALIMMYLYMGVSAGNELIWLGLWLFLLTVIVSIWYLGYTGLILELFGGLSMLAAAAILYLWSLHLRD